MKYKLSMVGGSEDGDKIYCLIKCDKKILLRGMYDFNVHNFIILEFYTNKIPENTTPLKALQEIKVMLDLNYDWELKGIAKLVKLIEEKKLGKKKRKHKNKSKS